MWRSCSGRSTSGGGADPQGTRVARSVLVISLTKRLGGGFERLRAHPLLSRVAVREAWQERTGHAVEPVHLPHVAAALDWLERAQDATGGGGVARGYSLAWNPYFKARGWQP